MSDLDTALREADRVRKKQKTCASASSDILDQLLKELTAARASLAEHGPAGAASVLKQLQNHLETRSLDKQLSDRTKELHSAVAKLGKVSLLAKSIAQKVHSSGLKSRFVTFLRIAGDRQSLCARCMQGYQGDTVQLSSAQPGEKAHHLKDILRCSSLALQRQHSPLRRAFMLSLYPFVSTDIT